MTPREYRMRVEQLASLVASRDRSPKELREEVKSRCEAEMRGADPFQRVADAVEAVLSRRARPATEASVGRELREYLDGLNESIFALAEDLLERAPLGAFEPERAKLDERMGSLDPYDLDAETLRRALMIARRMCALAGVRVTKTPRRARRVHESGRGAGEKAARKRRGSRSSRKG
jgi:hypothetical protein